MSYLPSIASDVASEITSGAVCGECGTGFVQAHHHPVLCHFCWRHSTDRGGFQRATLDEHAQAIGKARSRRQRDARQG